MKNVKEEKIIKYLRNLMMRCLFLIVIFLVLAILSKSSVEFKNYIYKNIYTDNISFSKIKKIYNKYLGGVVPLKKISNDTYAVFKEKLEYNDISKYLDGVKLEVGDNYLVPVINSGLVLYIGQKDGYNNTVIIEGENGVDIWYGNMSNVSLKLYDYVEAGSLLGEVNNNTLYLVYSEDNDFLNVEDYSYILMALGFVLTGHMTNLLIFTLIILIHEMGHYLIALRNGFNVLKITIYPYGGMTKLNYNINEKISKELEVAFGGIFFQIIFYLIMVLLYNYGCVREYIFDMYKQYNISILMFNILPIYPLDGGKILNLLLFEILPYKLANKVTVYLSLIIIIVIMIHNYYDFNYTMFLTLSILLEGIYKYYRDIDYLFNKFLLERYLYKIMYNKIKITNKLDKMQRDRTHIFKVKNRYISEEIALNKRFSGKM